MTDRSFIVLTSITDRYYPVSVTMNAQQKREWAIRKSKVNLEFMRRVRAHFILRGTTYTQWARANHIHPSTASYAILIATTGRKTRAVRERLLQELGEMASGKMGGVK